MKCEAPLAFPGDSSKMELGLCTGEMRPPVTIVLVNNGGGGIFDFLPIAQEVPQETFTQLWSTPQNVDLAGTMFHDSWQECDAHGAFLGWLYRQQVHALTRLKMDFNAQCFSTPWQQSLDMQIS